MKYPISALVVRKVGNTISESVYEQLKECAEIMGVYQYFEFKVSPLQIAVAEGKEYGMTIAQGKEYR